MLCIYDLTVVMLTYLASINRSIKPADSMAYVLVIRYWSCYNPLKMAWVKALNKRIGRRNWELLGWSAGLVALWRLCLEILNQTIVPFMVNTSTGLDQLRHSSQGFGRLSLGRWLMYDANHYKIVIESGYIPNLPNGTSVESAFFPVYPLAVRYISNLFHLPAPFVGMAINLVLLTFTVFFLYKLTLLLADRAKIKNGQLAAKFAVLLLLLNPSSFFFGSLYADALLVFLITAGTYLALQKKYFKAALLIGIATATKSQAIVMVPALGLMYIVDNWSAIKARKELLTHVKRLVAIGALGLSGLFVYMIYLWHRFSDPLLFLHVQKYWARKPTSIDGIITTYKDNYADIVGAIVNQPAREYMYHLYLKSLPIIVLGLAIYIIVKHGWKYAWLSLFCFLLIMMPISTGGLLSLNRFVLVLTPLMAYVAVYLYSRNRYWRLAGQACLWISATFLIFMSLCFLDGFFLG